jgi:hypothetical protein
MSTRTCSRTQHGQLLRLRPLFDFRRSRGRGQNGGGALPSTASARCCLLQAGSLRASSARAQHLPKHRDHDGSFHLLAWSRACSRPAQRFASNAGMSSGIRLETGSSSTTTLPDVATFSVPEPNGPIRTPTFTSCAAAARDHGDRITPRSLATRGSQSNARISWPRVGTSVFSAKLAESRNDPDRDASRCDGRVCRPRPRPRSLGTHAPVVGPGCDVDTPRGTVVFVFKNIGHVGHDSRSTGRRRRYSGPAGRPGSSSSSRSAASTRTSARFPVMRRQA